MSEVPLQLLKVLPHAISREALRTIGEKALLSLEIFKGLDPLLVGHIYIRLKMEMFFTDDVIYDVGEYG